MYPDRVPEFGTDNLIEVEVGIVPKSDPAPDETVEIIRCQANDWPLDSANLYVLPQATFNGSKVIVNNHAGVYSICINCRTGSDVR